MRKVKITIETILFFYLTVFASFFNALDDWNQDSVLPDLIRLSIYMLPMVVLVGMVQYAYWKEQMNRIVLIIIVGIATVGITVGLRLFVEYYFQKDEISRFVLAGVAATGYVCPLYCMPVLLLYSVLLVVKWFRMKKRGASAENDSKEQMLSGNKATGYFRIFSMGILFL